MSDTQVDALERLHEDLKRNNLNGFRITAYVERDAIREIESLRQQLAESQAREKVLRDALGWYAKSNVTSVHPDLRLETKGWCDDGEYARRTLTLPSDSTALDSAIRQAKREGGREALLEAADEFDNDGEYSGYGNALRCMADELKG